MTGDLLAYALSLSLSLEDGNYGGVCGCLEGKRAGMQDRWGLGSETQR